MNRRADNQLLLARQPIFDRDTSVVAYELHFRQVSPEEAQVVDDDSAASAVLENEFINLPLVEAIQRGELETIDWSMLADYGFSPELVNELYLEAIQRKRQVSSELEF